MPFKRVVRAILCVSGCLAAGGVAAAPCGADASRPALPEIASRIANIACAEHRMWFEPFIDANGRLASLSVSEAEGVTLGDGATPVWRRVAQYWQGSGLRWTAGMSDGAVCLTASADSPVAAMCRSFLVDTPWSAVFISYVMQRAGLVGFQPTSRHVDYVRDAHRAGPGAPFRLADPGREPPSVGDLLCFVRVPGQAFGYAGFVQWLDRPLAGALAMHCDIVVSIGDGRARTIGGNVLQGVTMRMLPVNRNGHLWSLPRRGVDEPRCTPDQPAACNFNRQDWVALLKLDPNARATDVMPAPLPVPATPGGACCDVCQLPMPAGVKRCDVPAPQPRIGNVSR